MALYPFVTCVFTEETGVQRVLGTCPGAPQSSLRVGAFGWSGLPREEGKLGEALGWGRHGLGTPGSDGRREALRLEKDGGEKQEQGSWQSSLRAQTWLKALLSPS